MVTTECRTVFAPTQSRMISLTRGIAFAFQNRAGYEVVGRGQADVGYVAVYRGQRSANVATYWTGTRLCANVRVGQSSEVVARFECDGASSKEVAALVEKVNARMESEVA